jgi:ABC-type branched-subunit amino acid transport system ATPase component
MVALARGRKARGDAFVIVEQNLEFVHAVANDLMVIDHGECLLKGEAAEFGREALEAHLMV